MSAPDPVRPPTPCGKWPFFHVNDRCPSQSSSLDRILGRELRVWKDLAQVKDDNIMNDKGKLKMFMSNLAFNDNNWERSTNNDCRHFIFRLICFFQITTIIRNFAAASLTWPPALPAPASRACRPTRRPRSFPGGPSRSSATSSRGPAACPAGAS